MAFRSCAYKKCGNYINLKDRSINSSVKLFSFPKNPERRKKWIELGQVPKNLPESMCYFCSDHFDKNFQAVNNRRTILVGEALPYPYVEAENEECYIEAESDAGFVTYNLARSSSENKEEYTNEQNIVVESTTISSDIQDSLDEQQLEDEHEEYITYFDDVSIKDEPISYNIAKRKSYITFTPATSSKPKIPKTSQVQKTFKNSSDENNDNYKLNSNVSQTKNLLSNKEACEEDSMNSNDLVDTKHVTAFIFKGEEYVQMPKDYYLNEKMEMIKKIQRMERALEAIKTHLNSLDM